MLTFMLIMVSITFICVGLATAMGVDIDKAVVKKAPVQPVENIRKGKRRRK